MEDTTVLENEETTGKEQLAEITSATEGKAKAPEKAEKESKWYVLRVVSGKERKIKEYLDKDIIRNGWEKVIVQIFLTGRKGL
jgi:hypothetical protein